MPPSGPDFDKYFERDFISAEEFCQLFGVGVSEVFTIAGFDLRETFDKDTRKNVGKPVVFLVGVDRPVFLNRGSHEAMLERFGPGYSANPKTVGQLVTITTERKLMSKPGTIPEEWMFIVWFQAEAHPDQHAPIGPKIAEKWLARLAEFGGTPDKFLRWLQPKSAWQFDTLKNLAVADYPRGAMLRMGEYVEASLKTAPRDPTTGKVEAPKQPAPASKPAAPVTPTAPAKPPEKPVEITEDDIPF